jgi:hypothetical protein
VAASGQGNGAAASRRRLPRSPPPGIPPLTALAAAEESGYINWARVIPTATVGWLVHQGIVSEEGLTGGLKAALRAVTLA